MISLNVGAKKIHQLVNIRKKTKTNQIHIENQVMVASAEMGEGGII